MSWPDHLRTLCVGRDGDPPGDELERAGPQLDVTQVTGLDDAERHLRNGEYDCLVADCPVRDGDGLPLLESVRADHPDLPFLVYTSAGSEALASDAFTAGASDYFDRADADPNAVAERVEDLVDDYRSGHYPERAVLSIFDQIPRGVLIENENRDILTVNETFRELFDIPPSVPLVGRDSERVAEEIAGRFEDPDHFLATTNALVADRERTTGQRLATESGRVLERSHLPIDLMDGPGSAWVYGDVTEEHQREVELERYETIVEATGDPVYVLDDDATFTFVNDAFVSFTGYEREELLGEPGNKIMHDEDVERGEDLIRSLLSSNTPGSTDVFEMDVVTAADRRIPCENHVGVLPYEDSFEGTVGVLRDISGRIRRARELEQERDRLDAVLEAAPYPLVKTVFEDGEPVVRRVNEAFTDTFGYDAADITGEILDEYIVPDAEQDCADKLNADIQDGESVETEVTRSVAGGDHHDFLFKATSVTAADGTTEVLATYVDVTERNRRIEKLDQIKQSVTEVVWMTSPDKAEMDFVSDAYEDIWGRSPDSLLESPASFINGIHEDDRERVLNALERQEERPDEYEETYRVVQPDGEVRWVHDSSSGFYEDGELKRIVGVANDITEQKRRERDLRTFQKSVESAGHAIYWMDSDGVIEYVNPTFEAQTGYSAGEATGETPELLLADDENPEVFDEMWAQLRDGERWAAEFVAQRRNGERYKVDHVVSPVVDDGDIERYVAVASDVTVQHNRVQQLSVLQRVLRHDLRNNLNQILLAVQLLDRKLDGSEKNVDKHLESVTETVEETLSLANQIREAQKVFSADSHEATTVVDLAATARRQVSVLETERPDVDVSVSAPAEAPAVTLKLVGRALRNLIQNAVEHNESDQPRVAVTVEQRTADNEVAVRVADNGPGIPETERKILTAEEEGQLDHLSGFGLWLVHWVTSLSGGRLEFEDNEPRGTVVAMKLPAATEEE
jgi:PAS domain S-box-containing protein